MHIKFELFFLRKMSFEENKRIITKTVFRIKTWIYMHKISSQKYAFMHRNGQICNKIYS